MRKNLFFILGLMFLILFSGQIKAQKVIADWDTKDPVSSYAWSGVYEQGADNPDPTGINTSSKVAKWQRENTEAAKWQAIELHFESSKLMTSPILSAMVYWPEAGKINVALKDENGNEIKELDCEITTPGVWTEVQFDFADFMIASNTCNKLIIYGEKGAVNDLTYYFDNFKFISGFSEPTDVLINREKFNGAPMPWNEFLGLTSDVTTWTSQNGTITNDSIQILIYTKPEWDGPYSYPEPSKGAIVRLGTQSGTQYLKTDTLILSEIDVKGFKDYRVMFTTGGYYNTVVPNIQVKADDGDWVSLTYTNNNVDINKMLQYEIPTGIATAEKMAIKFACAYEHSGLWIDDIGLIGTAIKTSSINVTTNLDSTEVQVSKTLQFGYYASPNNAYDTAVVWSVVDGTGSATIDANGKLTPVSVGTVTVKATAVDGSGVVGEKQISILYDDATAVTVSGTGDATTITTNGGTLQMLAEVAPATANPTVTWSVDATDADTASISSDGLLTAIRNGVVSVKATTTDGSDITGVLDIAITNQIVKPSALVIADATVNTNDVAVQMSIASSTPADADKSVTWSIESNDADTATITDEGLLTPLRNGKITVKATSTSTGVTLSTTKEITITGQIIEVTDVTITSSETITAKGGQLSLLAVTTPADAANQTIIWSIVSDNDADTASLSGNVLTAIRNGKVTVRATSDEDDLIYDEMEITISGQSSDLESISITGSDITTNAGTSQMTAVLTPGDAENVNIKWSLNSAADSAKATISSIGMVEAFRNGSITVVAKDQNSSVQATKTVAILGQVLVSEFKITTANNATTITENGGSLQVSAEVLPANARIKDIVWSIVSAGGGAGIDQTGLIKAKKDGDVYVKITAQDDGEYADSVKITISGQVLVESVDILVTADTINTDNGTLILPINVSPDNAADTTVTWSISSNDADTASIDATTGLITPIRNGSIKVMAIANGDTSLKDSAIVVITNQKVAPTAISLVGTDSVNTIDDNDGTLQMIANVIPTDAVADVEWGISGDKFDIATISETGLVTAFRDGVVFVQATSTLAPTVSGRYELTITNQVVEPTKIKIVSETGNDSILVNDGTLSLLAKVTPDDAVADVTWSIDASDVDTASISETGILTAIRNGKVTVKAISTAADTVVDTFEVTIANQIIEPTAISIVGTDSVSNIDVDNGTLALLINTTPVDAVKDVYWSMAANDVDTASINSEGVVTALQNGIATIVAVSTVDSTVVDTFNVTITNQVDDVILPEVITVKGEGNVTEITVNAGTLQMIAEVTPLGADTEVIWSIASDDVTVASISKTGLLTAITNGTVTVVATSVVADTISGQAEITISGQTVLVSEIVVSSEGDVTEISEKEGALQLIATVTPDNATNTSVTWSVDDEKIAIVSEAGLLTAVANGDVTVTATANDGSGISGSIDITVSNQVGVETLSDFGIKVYPNPVKDVLYINNANAIKSVKVIDVNGKVIISKSNNEMNLIKLDTEFLNSGVYIVKIHTQNKVLGFNIVK